MGKVVREEEVRGRPFDPVWVDIRDAARVFLMALKVGNERSRFNIFHIQADNPDARFPVARAKERLSYQPEYDFRS